MEVVTLASNQNYEMHNLSLVSCCMVFAKETVSLSLRYPISTQGLTQRVPPSKLFYPLPSAPPSALPTRLFGPCRLLLTLATQAQVYLH